MPEMILPGVYIEVRPEGLIVPGQVSVGNVGVVGTASRGPVGVPTLLGSYEQARQVFGESDAWDPDDPDALSLVRALQLAFTHGSATVFAVRVAGGGVGVPDAQGNVGGEASLALASGTGNAAVLRARTPGTWGNDITVNVAPAEVPAVIEDEEHTFTGGPDPLRLARSPVMESARTRIRVTENATGTVRERRAVFGSGAPGPNEVRINPANGELSFGTALAASDVFRVTYLVPPAQAVKVTIRAGAVKETYTVVDGADLVADVNDETGGSTLVRAVPGDQPDERPEESPGGGFAPLQGGENGASGADYAAGLERLLGVDAHILVGAGRDDTGTFAAALAAHCDLASSDAYRRDRIGVLGSRPAVTLDQLVGHSLDSDRVIFVAPGILARDPASGADVQLPGSYAAAAVAGKLSSLSPHVSLTNRTLAVAGLTREFDPAALAQLVKARVLVLERRQGFRVVKGITTSTGGAFAQITTRRIVDYAKYGVRSAAQPYIGLLNNERVRGAMHATINTFLDGMVKDEMLTGYQLAVTATREEERQGIARVTMTLRPTFSIDYVKVTMFLE